MQDEEYAEVCSPSGQCELCPHHWRASLESEDETNMGEFNSCIRWGRRERFDCTSFYEPDSSEKITKSRSEYRPCKYTESDEQFRMARMQMVCLLIGILSIRMVKRYKVYSASLFDRRKINAHNNTQLGNSPTNSAGAEIGKVRYIQVPREDSMETIELKRVGVSGKVPKSPAPNLETV